MSKNMTKSKAKWRSHRGVLELDAILLPYVENRFDNLSTQLRNDFFSLLDQQDPKLQSLLIYSNDLDQNHPLYSIVADIKKNNQLFK